MAEKCSTGPKTSLQQAVEWVSKQKESGHESIDTVVSNACARFNLSPQEGLSLEKLFLHK